MTTGRCADQQWESDGKERGKGQQAGSVGGSGHGGDGIVCWKRQPPVTHDQGREDAAEQDRREAAPDYPLIAI